MAPVLALAVWVLAAPVGAAEIRVVRSVFESKFPASMTFTMDATTSRPVQRATVWYRVAGRRTLVSSDAEVAQGGGTIRASHEFDLSRDYLPPGTQLQYYWELQDDQGGRSRTETKQETLEDKRFQWRQMKQLNLEVNWYQGNDDFGRAIMGIAGRQLTVLGQELGVTLDRPVRVMVYGGREDFQSAAFRGGLEWVGGSDYPLQNVVLVYAPPNQQGTEIARRAIPHELTHAVVHQVTDNPFGEAPQWLNEGLATHAEPTFNQDQYQALSKAIVQGKLISLRALGGAFPVDADEALLAYGEGYSAVSFLMEKYGRGRISQLLQAYHEGVTYDEGLRRALGFDQTELDKQWRAWLAPWPFMKADPFDGPPPPEPPTAREVLFDWYKRLSDEVWGKKDGN